MVGMEGRCLCGALAFNLKVEKGEIYQCHCSKCRRVTGSAANANLIVKLDDFRWLKESAELQRYVTEMGWVSSFCKRCGSRAPIIDKKRAIVYVPAGSLHQDKTLSVTLHIHTGSKASWDIIGGEACQKEKQ